MNRQRKKDIRKTIELYKELRKNKGAGQHFTEYSRFYIFTNEDLANIFMQMDLRNVNSALCPTASGDHALNLAYFGVKEIDTFDCNRVAEYYAKFKEVAVASLSYEYYQRMMLYTYVLNNKLIQKEVIASLPDVYRKFWEEVLYVVNDIKKDNRGIFELTRLEGEGCRSSYNIYQRSKEDYERLQRNLRDTKITFTNCDIKDVPNLFGKKDFITFSNILEYRRKFDIFPSDYECAEFIKRVYNEQLNDFGNLLYFYNYFDEPDKVFDTKEFMMYLNFGIKKTYGSCHGEALCLKKF